MTKDWTGNYTSIYKTLGASSHTSHEREQNDYYATDPKTIQLLLNSLINDNIKLSSNIWEPACGEGHISKVLESLNYNVYSTDLIDRGFGIGNKDFLTETQRPFDSFDIVTNPPYKFAEDFAYKGLGLLKDGEKLIMLLKIQFLEGQSRYELFKNYPPKYVYVHSSRQTCALNGEFINKDGKEIGSAVCYAWYIWEKGFKGDTIIRWIK